MDPKHINALKIQLLNDRMCGPNLKPSRPSDSNEPKPVIQPTPESDKMQIEDFEDIVKPHPLVKITPETQVGDLSEESEEEKEDPKTFVDLESSEKIEDIKPKNTLGTVGSKDGMNNQNISCDLSYESGEPKGSRSIKSIKKRKFEGNGNNNSENRAETFELATKRSKLTLNPFSNTETGQKVDSFGSSVGQETALFNKENITAGTKKITEFFKPMDGMTASTVQKAYRKTPTSSKPVKLKAFNVEKKTETITEVKSSKEVDDDKKELYMRIKELEDKNDSLKKEREREQIKAENERAQMKEQIDTYKGRVEKTCAKFVIEIEIFKRNERKAFLSRQRQRLGEYVSQREGSKFVDVWSDGYEMRQVKEKLENLIKEREELEKQNKSLKNKKTVTTTKQPIESSERLGTLGNLFGFSEDSGSNSIIDIKETKERINAKITMLQREEQSTREQLEKLEAEKVVFYQIYKKQYEEDHSRYGKPNPETNAPAWPILSDRYQLLSLLGKGGFSEVYKAYDLEELVNVACKVHQLNPNWTEKAKSNYVKHANREFEVHKELNHPNIVRLFDCINIDDHSFATVLEYCEGPDLSMYLKQHKILPEKDAKIIIKQILAGLKYLSDHKTKIIHYDLKPQNVLFSKGEIKISDFGLCKIVDNEASRIELTSQGVGTYWYLPPECFLMDDQPPLINNKVDVWSIGVMFFEMVYGQRPFGHNMSQEKILKEQVILKSRTVNFPASKVQVSNETKEFIKKCLAYNQEDRIDIYEAYDLLYFGKK